MKLVVGLGNPGEEYAKSRHNLGFIVLDHLVDSSKFKLDEKLQGEIAKVGQVIYLKPQTFVNNSGEAVSAVARYYKIKPADVIVIHDDLDLPFGKAKFRIGDSSAGHRGVASVIKLLKTQDFWRLRAGISKPKDDIKDFVLAKFSKAQLEKIATITEAVEQLIKKPGGTTLNFK